MSKKTQGGLLPFDQRVFGLIEEFGEECFVHPEIGEDLRELIKRWREIILDPNSSEWVKKQNRANLRKIGISLSKPESPKKGRPTKTYEDERSIWEPWIKIKAPEMLEVYRSKCDDGSSLKKAKKEAIARAYFKEELLTMGLPTMTQKRADWIERRLKTFSWENQRSDGFSTNILTIILGHRTPSSSKATKSRRKRTKS
ncbi:MAG: hypothetical protein RX318_04570 [bacterium]|nr:hypothetical protein [bacterium]